jgi:hypothetical protein
MADVLAVALSIVGTLLTLPALWLLMRALFPAAVERGRERLRGRPIVSFLVGLLASGLLLGGGLVLVNASPNPGGKALGFVLLVAWFLIAGVGFASFSALIGERLPGRDDEGRPWRPLLRGAACLELSFLFPLLGWFGVLPIAAAAATGAAALALASRADAAAPAPGPAAA